MLGLLLAGCASAPVAAPAAQGPDDAALWHWGPATTVSASHATALRRAGVGRLWRWVGRISQQRGALVYAQRGGAVAGLDALPWEACVRLDADTAKALETDGGRDVYPLLLAAARQAHADGAVGLQIDWDVPTRLLPAYAAWLGRLRRDLDPRLGLSCTALLTWLDAPGFAAVAAAVDLVVPQCYALDPPAAEATRIVGGDPVPAARRCAALGRPHRIALATYEQTVVHAADGSLRTVAAPLAAEDLLAAGLRLRAVQNTGAERILDLHCPSAVQVGRVLLQAGDRVRCAQPRAAGLMADLAALNGAAGAGWLGTAWFRLPGATELPAYDGARLARVLTGTATAPAVLRSKLRHDGEAWFVDLANPGDEDFTSLTPATVTLLGAEPAPAWQHGGISWLPARDGQPSSPLRADGARLDIVFVRAGAQLAVPLVLRHANAEPRLRP